MPDQGGGPIPLVVTSQCPPSPSPQLNLFIPATVDRVITADQRARIALIEVEFAQGVSALLTRSYIAIAELLNSPTDQGR
jgi:hypothetical protein